MKADTTRSSFEPAKHFRTVRRQQGRVDLDADWNEQQDIIDHLRTTTTEDLVGPHGGPMDGAAFELDVNGTDLTVSTGTYYVDGVLVEVEGPDFEISVWDQPDVPAGAPIVELEDGTTVPGPTPPKGRYRVYADVWDLHRTALEDPAIREVALGGPDSTTRAKTVWLVKLTRAGDVGADVLCEPPPPEGGGSAETGTLEARAEPAATDTGPCVVPAGAGFRGLENQHYRVEIHKGGLTGETTFLWARDNASTVASWADGPDPAGVITVASPGRDSVRGFAPGMWVELTDDTRELLGQPGKLVQLTNVTGNRLTLSSAAGIALADFPLHPRVRRWDSDGAQTVERPAANDGWLALEDGVQIRFPDEKRTFRTGDYWTIPARTVIADVLWPEESDGTPAEVPPHGIVHHYAPIALVDFDGTEWTDPHDCRHLFPALIELVELRAVSGDGQTATPPPNAPNALVELAEPLVVGVSNGSFPVEGAKVVFIADTGEVNGQPTVVVDTDSDGLAQVAWEVDSTTPIQQVGAQLLDEHDDQVGLPVGFTASLLTAARTAYTPSGDCPDLAGTTTVQQAIDKLCQQEQPVEKVMRIKSLRLRQIEKDLENDSTHLIKDLRGGIDVFLTHKIAPETANRATCFVTVELPWPTSGSDRELWGLEGLLAYQPLVLAADIPPEEELIHWRPTETTLKWLERVPPMMREFHIEDRVLCRLTLKGNSIMSKDRKLYLDGEAFLHPKQGQLNIALHSGDGRKGGDFELWFWLTDQAE